MSRETTMRLILFATMIVLPIMEIAVFIVVGKAIGLWPTLAGIFLTALIGSAIIRHQGVGIVASARKSLAAGEAPLGEVAGGLALFVAGALLVTPGFVTDTIGFLLLVPAFRRALARAAVGQLARRGGVQVFHAGGPAGGRAGAPGGAPGSGPAGWPGAGPGPAAAGDGAGVVIEGEWRDLDDDRPQAPAPPDAPTASARTDDRATAPENLPRVGTGPGARGR